jgi:hypothetical protein
VVGAKTLGVSTKLWTSSAKPQKQQLLEGSIAETYFLTEDLNFPGDNNPDLTGRGY